MIFKQNLKGFDEFLNFINTFNTSEKLILLFTGAATATTPSWCPDCVAADPVIEKVLDENQNKTFHFVKVSVGTRDEWKDPKCAFRTDARVKLTSVPTLLLWGTVNRLNDSECQDPDNIRLLLEDL